MSARDQIIEYLSQRGICHRVHTHPPVCSMEDCKRYVESATGAFMPKNILLTPRNRGAYYLYITRPELPFKTADISKKLSSSRLSFAEDGALPDLLLTEPLALSPLGLIFDRDMRVRLVIERAVLNHSLLAFHPNARDASVLLSCRDFVGAFLPSLAVEPLVIDA